MGWLETKRKKRSRTLDLGVIPEQVVDKTELTSARWVGFEVEEKNSVIIFKGDYLKVSQHFPGQMPQKPGSEE